MTDEIGMLWRKSDIERVIKALASAGKDRSPEYHAALNDVALAVGVIGDMAQQNGFEWLRPVYDDYETH